MKRWVGSPFNKVPMHPWHPRLQSLDDPSRSQCNQRLAKRMAKSKPKKKGGHTFFVGWVQDGPGDKCIFFWCFFFCVFMGWVDGNCWSGNSATVFFGLIFFREVRDAVYRFQRRSNFDPPVRVQKVSWWKLWKTTRSHVTTAPVLWNAMDRYGIGTIPTGWAPTIVIKCYN